jgi:NCAIR mutase (PurE)-related protein
VSDGSRTYRPFDALRFELDGSTASSESMVGTASRDVRVDPHREARTGIPEVVLAETKTVDQVVDGLARLARVRGRAVASRCTREMLSTLPVILREREGLACDVIGEAAAIVAIDPGHTDASIKATGAVVGVITAGTSDIRVASEAGLIATEMGCEVIPVRDVGVAGIHRLARPLEELMAMRPGAIIVAAGMDGALPSVVAGLVDVPVIGLPTSVGYGFGARGEAALMAMLQSCSLGLVVVNIDNGVGAGAAAARIANQRAHASKTDTGSTT